MRFASLLLLACAAVLLGALGTQAAAQTFRYEAEPRAGDLGYVYAEADAAPRMMLPPGGMAPPEPMQPAMRMAGRQQYGQAAYQRPYRPVAERLADRRQEGYLLAQNGEPVSRLKPAESIPPGLSVHPFEEDGMSHVQDPSSGIIYEGYDGGAQPLEPRMGDPSMYDPSMMGPPMMDESYGQCCGCENGCRRCYLKRCWSHLCCQAENGAYSENFTLYTGKQGFKGPVDLGVNGDFGYHGGGNWGMPFLESYGIGYQIGANYLVSDFEGRSGPLGHRRTQFFVTSGLFHRAECDQGFQYGAVVDYLRDDFYIQMDLTQVRGELGYYYYGHEVGFWGAFQMNQSTHEGTLDFVNFQTYSYEANNQYNLFYRYEFENGTFCRSWMGMSGHGDGIFGCDTTVRVSDKVGLVANYNYLLPRNDEDIPNNVKESWNLTISLVWYPGYKRCDSWRNPYRPLFYVADNGWFLTRQSSDETD